MAFNYATHATLVDFSSECAGCEASNVLDNNNNNIWLSESEMGLPQWIAISLQDLKGNDEEIIIRTLGFECWHP